MSANLLTLVTQFLTPEMIGKIAAALGVNSPLLEKAVAAAVPGLLGGLASAVATPDGQRKLGEAIAKQPPDLLDSFAGMLGGSGQKGLVENGSSLLSSLLGGGSAATLAGAVAKFAGLNSGAGSSLLGLLAPVVMGVLVKQKAAAGLDVAGLAQLLVGQKSSFAAALPPAFKTLLGDAAGAAPAASPPPAPEPAKRPNLAFWLIPLLVALALGWWFLGNRPAPQIAEQVTPPVAPTPTAPTPAPAPAQTAATGAADLIATARANFENVRQSLLNITDVASARAALPKLDDASAQLDKAAALANQLPALGKSALAAIVAAARPSLDDLFNRTLAVPGVADVAKPSIDRLKARLDALARA